MDAVKFISEFHRMCKSFKECDGNCPLYDTDSCSDISKWRNGAEVIQSVEQWAKDHPVKTQQSVFLERYPNAVTDLHGIIGLCKLRIDSTEKCQKFEMSCNECRRDYWSQEVE